MDLTSSTLLYSVIALTVVSVVLTVWLWPRLARRGFLWVLARLGMIVLSQVSLVLVVSLLINNYGDFYPSWNDLPGVGSASNQQVTFGSTSGGDTAVSSGDNALVVPDPGQLKGWRPSGPAASVGELNSVRILGRSSHLSALAYVYLPPQYFQPAYAHMDFPITTVYTGYPGNVQGLEIRLKTIEQFATLQRQGKIKPTVMVIMSQNVAVPRDTDCVDVVHGPQVDTFMSYDYVDAIHSAFRITSNPKGWGLEGYSEGGTCALELAMIHPSLFGVVGDLGGDYVDVEDGAQTGNLFGPKGSAGRTALLNHYSTYWRLNHLPAPDIQVLIATTKKEHDYAATQLFMRDVKPPMTAETMLLQVGGHNFTTWTIEQGPALIWMGQHMPGPVAAPTPRSVPTPKRTPAPHHTP